MLVNNSFENSLNTPLFLEHEKWPEIIKNVHRFRAINQEGLLALAKRFG